MENGANNHSRDYSEEELKKILISSSLTANIENIKGIIGKNADLIIRNIVLGRSKPIPAVLFFFDNLIDSHHLDDNIVSPLTLDIYSSGLNTGSEIIEQLEAGNVITRGEVKIRSSMNTLLDGVLSGDVGLLIDGIDAAYVISTKGYEYRSVAESDVEPVVRGPREAFIEVMSTNIGLIRRRIHNPSLVFELLLIGKVSKTKVCVAYIKGICPDTLLEEVLSRLGRIDIDGILESNYLEELIQDHPYSIFPQVRNTERPDVVAASLLEGRIAIIIDNTPVALIVPGEFCSLMQSAEDYYNRYTFSSAIRLLRYFVFGTSILLPAFYIAVVNFHQDMIPTRLLQTIISARVQVPFPASIEAFIMIISFEILHEAGIRLPRPIGQAVSIVGALVIGEAAVMANLVSPLMVIIVALTAITKFCIPQYNITLSIRLARIMVMVVASILGLYGVMVSILFLMLHLFSMESFGKPYMSPISPLRVSDIKNTIIRSPWWALVRHPAYGTVDSKHMPQGQSPHPSKKRGGQS